MSRRPSVQEILEAARRGNSAPASAEASQPATPPPSTSPSPAPAPSALGPQPRLSLQEKLEKAAADRHARSTARQAPASAPVRLSLQEKLEKAAAERQARQAAPARLSLQEKLEKAAIEREARVASRRGGEAVETAENGKPSIREKLERARVAHPIRQVAPPASVAEGEDAPDAAPAPAVAPAAPAEPKRLTLQEKLAAARVSHPIREVPKPAPEAVPAAEEAPEPTPAAPVVEAAPAAASAPAPDGPRVYRPMTTAEKLAAARSGKPSSAVAKSAPPAEAPAPKPAASSKGMSVQEKLAAARSGGSAPAPKPAAAPAAPAASKKGMTVQEKLAAARGLAPKVEDEEPAPVVASTEPSRPAADPNRVLPPLAEIADPKDLAEALRRAGTQKDGEAAARPPGVAPATRPSPFKPSDAPPVAVRKTIETPAKSQVRADRRGLLVYATWWMVVGWVALVAAITLLSGMMIRFLFPNADAEPPGTVKVGFPSDYQPGEVNERFKDRWGFWVVRDVDDRGRDVIFAVQAYCTHLGCPPTWLAGERKFKCRCHGSGFYKDGVNFEGPAPRPLERYKIGVADDGRIVVDKGQTFRKDLDQWSDPDSFLLV